MQKTQVPFQIWEDHTQHRATKPMCHNYWTCQGAATTEPMSPKARAPWQEEPKKKKERKKTKNKQQKPNSVKKALELMATKGESREG